METKQIYETPGVAVYGIRVPAVICQSPNGETEGYNEGDTGGWYNN